MLYGCTYMATVGVKGLICTRYTEKTSPLIITMTMTNMQSGPK